MTSIKMCKECHRHGVLMIMALSADRVFVCGNPSFHMFLMSASCDVGTASRVFPLLSPSLWPQSVDVYTM